MQRMRSISFAFSFALGRVAIPLAVMPLVMLLAVPTALAESRLAASGWFAEAGLGATAFIGDAADYSALGPTAEIRAGYEPWSWLALGAYVGLSTHEATIPPPPEGEYYQLYHGGVDVRVGFGVGPVGLFAEGSAGLARMSSNILSRVAVVEPGEQTSLSYGGGAGIEYQIQNRHYALGLAGHFMALPGFDATQGVSGRLYLRYTY